LLASLRAAATRETTDMYIAVLKKFALAGAVVSVTLLAAGCASRYDDDGYSYSDNGYRHRGYDRGDHWRDHHDSDDKRVRVCDEDGSDCHWEYRER
jgi:major membrane immunogen (membrane-anchored lipoprotein)